MTILRPTRVQIAFAAIVLAAMALVVEGGARLFFAVKEQLRNKVVSVDPSVLDDYEVPDVAHSWNWRPKAGYSATIDQIIQAKKHSGKVLGEKLLKQRAAELKIEPNAVVMRINADGFKGPDIDKTHSRVRIFTIGDSCTFGTMFDDYSYPRALERELGRLGKSVEVINAGVEGYGPANVLGRIEEFKALRPEITTIYIGWNALYAEPESYGVEYYLKSVRLFRKAYGKVREKIFGRTEMALEAYSKPKHIQRDAPEVSALDGFTPTFMTELETIVKEMRGCRKRSCLAHVARSLCHGRGALSQALKVGHLPTFTDNPYVLAKISEEYNKRLRRLAKSQNLLLVDLGGVEP